MSQQLPFSYVSLGTARQQLANRLFDATQTFWAPAELNSYIVESLRTWNALTNYWREDFLFSISQGGPVGPQWVDITNPTLLPTSPRPYTVMDTDLYNIIEYHLLEPPTGVAWTGSVQFTADDLLNAVARRRDQLLTFTACTQTRHLIPAVAGRITLPDIVLTVRRIAYLPNNVFLGGGYGTGLYGMGLYGVSNPPYASLPQPVTLFADDAWSEQAFDRLVPLLPAGTPSTPSVYTLTTEPPLSFDVDAPPSYAGQYEVLTVDAGLQLNPLAASPLSVPDDWTWVIKWGALADLLSRDSNARDPVRAAYCEQRYRMGLALLLNASAVLTIKINGVYVQIDSLHAADLYNTRWETTVPGRPVNAYHSGLNLLAFSPTPDAGIGNPPQPYSITATVVENAPVPVVDTDLVQMARGDYDAMLDYAQHLASFKQGGAEFAATQGLLERFLGQAALANRKLMEIGEFAEFLLNRSQVENNENPVETPQEAN